MLPPRGQDIGSGIGKSRLRMCSSVAQTTGGDNPNGTSSGRGAGMVIVRIWNGPPFSSTTAALRANRHGCSGHAMPRARRMIASASVTVLPLQAMCRSGRTSARLILVQGATVAGLDDEGDVRHPDDVRPRRPPFGFWVPARVDQREPGRIRSNNVAVGSDDDVRGSDVRLARSARRCGGSMAVPSVSGAQTTGESRADVEFDARLVVSAIVGVGNSASSARCAAASAVSAVTKIAVGKEVYCRCTPAFSSDALRLRFTVRGDVRPHSFQPAADRPHPCTTAEASSRG